MSSSGPDDKHAWLQVGAAALKHCVASGCIPEATLLLEAIRRPERAPLASGQITGADTITVELVAPDDMPAVIRIIWPLQPTVVDPRRFPDLGGVRGGSRCLIDSPCSPVGA
jgi:hypothetical protein